MIHFYGEELLAPRPTPKLEDHPLSAVRDCLFNIFAATLHIGSRSSIGNLRSRHAVVTGTDGFTSPSKEGVLRIFFALKNSSAPAGFEPANLGTKGQHAASRPPHNRDLLNGYIFVLNVRPFVLWFEIYCSIV